MTPWLILVSVGLLIGAAIALEAWLKRNRPARSLADKMCDEQSTQLPQLGMEATNLEVMDDALRANRHVSQMNDNHVGHSKNPFATFRASRPTPMPEDETYSRLYYQAFQKAGRGEENDDNR